MQRDTLRQVLPRPSSGESNGRKRALDAPLGCVEGYAHGLVTDRGEIGMNGLWTTSTSRVAVASSPVAILQSSLIPSPFVSDYEAQL